MGWRSTGDEWMGAPAAAQRLGIRVRTLYGIINRGELPAYKIARVIRLQRVDVDEYIARCRVQPGSLGHLYPAIYRERAVSAPWQREAPSAPPQAL